MLVVCNVLPTAKMILEKLRIEPATLVLKGKCFYIRGMDK